MINITWSVPDSGGNAESIKCYEVAWSGSDNNNSILETNDTSKIIDGLFSNENYIVSVRVVTNMNDYGKESEQVKATTRKFMVRKLITLNQK